MGDGMELAAVVVVTLTWVIFDLWLIFNPGTAAALSGFFGASSVAFEIAVLIIGLFATFGAEYLREYA